MNDIELAALRKQAFENDEQASNLRSIGGVADALGNQQSFGNYWLKQMAPENHAARNTLNAQAEAIKNPYAQKSDELKLQDAEGKINDDAAKRELEVAHKDPNSRQSLGKKGLYQSLGLKVEPDDSAYSLNDKYGPTADYTKAKFKEDIDRKQGRSTAANDPMKQLLYEDRKRKIDEGREKDEFAKTPEGRLQKLSGDQKGRLDNARGALQSVLEMEQALNNGDNTFSIIGDNDFTRAGRMLEESVGRMQSGGAISEVEAKRFRDMAPTIRDSAEMQKKKLASLKNEMAQRIHTLGFKPQDIGIAYTPQSSTNEKPVVATNLSDPTLSKANASSGMVKIKSPDGRVFNVPASQAVEAIKNGGKEVK